MTASAGAQESAAEPQPPREEAGPAAPSTSAQRVYLDPATGRLLSKPPPGVRVLRLSPRERRWLSTSHEGLRQTPRPGGGYRLDPQGRFRHMAVAVVGADGQITVRDVVGDVEAPAAGPPDEGASPEPLATRPGEEGRLAEEPASLPAAPDAAPPSPAVAEAEPETDR